MSDLHDLGLAHDLRHLVSRRRALLLLGGAGAAGLLAGCGSDSSTSSSTAITPGTAAEASTSSSTGSAGSTGAACAVIPAETAGPFPGDGSNGPNVLAESGVVREDIRSSFGSMSGTADGVETIVELTILDTARGCVPYAGAAVYLWHADANGDYSLYSSGVTDQNYLRGVQIAGADGKLRFRTSFPGCYPGRWPHMHFEVFPDESAATAAATKLTTSQIALPEDLCGDLYSSAAGYETSVDPFGSVSLDTDGVFRDGWSRELATASGDIGNCLVVALTVPV